MDRYTESRNYVIPYLGHTLRTLLNNRHKLRTTLGTIGCVAGKSPRRLHFFRHRTKLIEVLT